MRTPETVVEASRPTTPTLEREVELERIRQVLTAAAAGHGQVLVIEGPSGIGKSRLLEEACALARQAGMEILRARGGELERSYPFGVAVSLLEARFARASAAEREQLFRGRAALAAPLLSGGHEDVRHVSTTDEFALVHGLYWCAVNLAEHRPAALFIDDVHWADDLSLRSLIYLAQRLDDLPIVLIAAIRTGDPTAASEFVMQLSSISGSRSLRPTELTLDAARQVLMAAELPAPLPEEFVLASWQTTQGNPFLLRELVAAMQAEPDSWRAPDAESLKAFAPHTVGRSVVLRLSRLGSDAVRLARASAVLGGETSLARAARLAELDLPVAVAAAQRLLSAQILADIDPVAFTHPMIRTAVYCEFPLGERLGAHLAAAQLLAGEGAGPEQTSHHLLNGTPTDEPWAGEALHEGARAAARKGAPATAVRYLRRALDVSGDDQRRAAMLIDLGLVEAASGEGTSLARFEEALASIEELSERARALYALGQTLYRYGRHEEAATTFRRGADLLRGRDDSLWLMFEGAFMCCAQYLASVRADAVARLESLVASLPATAPSTAAERVLLANLALHRATNVAPATDAVTLARQALGDGVLLREQTSDSMAVNLAIIALVWSERGEEAQRAAEDVLADASRRGAALAFAEASMVRAMAMHSRGRVVDAIADAQASISGVSRGWHAIVPIPQAILVHCLIERGELDEAAAVVEDVEQLLPGPAALGLHAWFYWARGRLRLLRGDPASALADLLDAGRSLKPFGVRNPGVVQWRSLAGLAAHAVGDDAEAVRLIDEDVALARDFGVDAALSAALRARALVGEESAAAATLGDAVAAAERAGADLALAHALFELGGAQRRVGQRVVSREPLRRALALAHLCGASALEQRARDELLASGARPRRAAMTGVDALTPSERRIAELAAAGQTSRRIAETLFLTKNTVEWHLRHVYRKLGVASRAALRARLDEARASVSG
jgi:ATP/maltotriose-dependent transcriptional regulator MalT